MSINHKTLQNHHDATSSSLAQHTGFMNKKPQIPSTLQEVFLILLQTIPIVPLTSQE